jgi:predicted nucleotidyltransferase
VDKISHSNKNCMEMGMILTDEIKNKIVDQLKPLDPYKIIVFGSYAYGNADEESDLDICVVERDYKNRWEEKKKIREALKDIDIPKDILNPRLDEYDFYKREYGSVYKDIEDKGVVLWENS